MEGGGGWCWPKKYGSCGTLTIYPFFMGKCFPFMSLDVWKIFLFFFILIDNFYLMNLYCDFIYTVLTHALSR